MKKHILILTTFLLLLVSSAMQAGEIQAPDFKLPDASGKIHTMADYRGKPLILHFWATWCHFCERVQPALDQFYQTHKNQGLQVVGISYNETLQANPAAELKKRGIHFPTLLNGKLAAINYEVRGTPTTYFIDKNGNIVVATHISNPDDPRLAQYTAQIMAGH